MRLCRIRNAAAQLGDSAKVHQPQPATGSAALCRHFKEKPTRAVNDLKSFNYDTVP
jgi:hypothetical protein